MDDVEGGECDAVREQRVPTSTSALSHAMFATGAVSAADSCGAVSDSATGSTPRSGPAPNVVGSVVLVIGVGFNE